MPNTPKHVVILGAGYAGATLARELEKVNGINITLIDRKNYFQHAVATLRAFVEEPIAEQVLIPTNSFFTQPQHKVLYANVASIQKDSLRLESGEEIKFDYLVLAMGSSYTSPIKASLPTREQALAAIKTTFNDVKNAESILIIGAGSVGIELAGEIATDYPDKKVTLIHNKKDILQGPYPDKFRNRIRQSLEKSKVNLILNDRIDLPSDFDGRSKKTLTTANGKSIESDVQFVCAGIKPNTSLVSSLDPQLLNESQLVKVNQFLQLSNPAYEKIFAIGDIAASGEVKTSMVAAAHASYVAKVLKSLSGGKQVSSSKPYKPNNGEMIIVSTGRNGGAFNTPLGVLGNSTSKMMKSKGLFISNIQSLIVPKQK